MSNFEDLERQEKMIFLEENYKEDKENIIQKEQKGFDDFIKNLDKRIYKDLRKFPLKYPGKITYSESIKMGDDFILLSVNDDFYLFPKPLKNKLLDYIKFERYVKENPLIFNFTEKGLNKIYNTCILSFFIISTFAILFSMVGCALENDLIFKIGIFSLFTLPIPLAVGAFVEEDLSAIKNFNKYNVFLSKLEKLNFPLEFFKKQEVNIYIKTSEIDDKYKELFPNLTE